jgi:hypothetical protein
LGWPSWGRLVGCSRNSCGQRRACANARAFLAESVPQHCREGLSYISVQPIL